MHATSKRRPISIAGWTKRSTKLSLAAWRIHPPKMILMDGVWKKVAIFGSRSKDHRGRFEDQREYVYYSQIMASQSPLIDVMLASPMNESKSRKIKLPDLAPKDWGRMMKCLELKNSQNMTLKDAVELVPLNNKYEFREGLEFVKD